MIHPRSTHGRPYDHRRVLIHMRAQDRTQRRALLLLAAMSQALPGDVDPALAHRMDVLIGEADALRKRL